MKRIYIFVIAVFISFGYCTMQHDEDEKIAFKDDRFRNFYDELTGTEDSARKAELVGAFISSLDATNYPILENDTTAVLLYRHSNGSVSVLSDLTDMAEAVPMEQISGTDLHYTRLHARTDARIEYFFISEEHQIPFTDPLNPYRINYTVWTASELAMPAYKREPIFDPLLNGQPGGFERVIGHTLEGNIMGYSHLIHVYLPEGYNESDKQYPVLYFQDGSDYIESAYVPYVLDALIGQKRIEPLIAVFVTPPNRHQPNVPNRMTEYGMNNDYVSFFTDELVPYIDGNYRTMEEPEHRIVIGDSFGGLISLYIAFQRPDVFGSAYSQSGYVSFQNDKLIRLIESSSMRPVRFYVDIGIYERNVGSLFLPADETDFLEGNRRLRKVLEEKGYDFRYKEYSEGHTWGNWRRHLIDVLEDHFGK